MPTPKKPSTPTFMLSTKPMIICASSLP